MKTYDNPPVRDWPRLVSRPQVELTFLDGAVRNIMDRVRRSGDRALRELTLQYDKVEVNVLQVSDRELNEAGNNLDGELKNAIAVAAGNIERFHASQKINPLVIETMPGVTCWRKAVPIEKIGIYIPGGSAPLFSTVLMLGIPARLAECREIVLCTPPGKEGKIHAAILYAAQLVGITRIFKIGGAQAIAALAYGTESVPAVYKIFGPGNQFVTKAKQLVLEEGIAIDMPAGPSEVLVLADETADAGFVAADLLSQAEHGEDSQVMLVALDDQIIGRVQMELSRQLAKLPRRDLAHKALSNSRAVRFTELDSALAFINTYAPEHLIINTRDASNLAEAIKNAGSVFIGNYSAEAIGDYASGTNHTLPTNGFARSYAGVSLDSFVKYITFQQVNAEGIRAIGPIVETMAAAEQLTAHQMAIRIRLEKLLNKPERV